MYIPLCIHAAQANVNAQRGVLCFARAVSSPLHKNSLHLHLLDVNYSRYREQYEDLIACYTELVVS